jgi:hypothetical protein
MMIKLICGTPEVAKSYIFRLDTYTLYYKNSLFGKYLNAPGTFHTSGPKFLEHLLEYCKLTAHVTLGIPEGWYQCRSRVYRS